jgi:hypothetical protein
VIKERQERRAREPWTASEGRWDVYLAQKQAFEPPNDLPATQRLRLDTTLPISDQMALVMEALTRKAIHLNPANKGLH